MIPKEYNNQSVNIASYDYYNIQEGTGITKFYGWKSNSSLGTAYNLGTQVLYSYTTETSDNNATQTASVDCDFDLSEFNTPRDIKGVGVVTFCGAIDADVQSASGSFTVYVRKVSSGVESEIVSATTQDIGDLTTDGDDPVIFNLITDIPETHFKPGDNLRLSIIGAATKTAGINNFHIAFGHDPYNRDGTYIKPSTDTLSTSQLIFACPFKLDL